MRKNVRVWFHSRSRIFYVYNSQGDYWRHNRKEKPHETPNYAFVPFIFFVMFFHFFKIKKWIENICIEWKKKASFKLDSSFRKKPRRNETHLILLETFVHSILFARFPLQMWRVKIFRRRVGLHSQLYNLLRVMESIWLHISVDNQ